MYKIKIRGQIIFNQIQRSVNIDTNSKTYSNYSAYSNNNINNNSNTYSYCSANSNSNINNSNTTNNSMANIISNTNMSYF